MRRKKAFKQEQRSKAGRMVFVVGFVCSDVGGGWKIWEVSLILARFDEGGQGDTWSLLYLIFNSYAHPLAGDRRNYKIC